MGLGAQATGVVEQAVQLLAGFIALRQRLQTVVHLFVEDGHLGTGVGIGVGFEDLPPCGLIGGQRQRAVFQFSRNILVEDCLARRLILIEGIEAAVAFRIDQGRDHGLLGFLLFVEGQQPVAGLGVDIGRNDLTAGGQLFVHQRLHRSLFARLQAVDDLLFFCDLTVIACDLVVANKGF